LLNLLNIAPIATITIITGSQGRLIEYSPISSSAHAIANNSTITQNVGNFAILVNLLLSDLNRFLKPKTGLMFV